MDELTFTVEGKPEPGGSKKGFLHPHTKQVIVVDANAKVKPWRNLVASVAQQRFGLLVLEGPLAVTFKFYVERPKGHYGTGANELHVRESAPARPGVRPDVLKLARAVEDALTDILWRDDAQIVEEHIEKHYGLPQRVEIHVRQLEETVVQVEGQLALSA
jgi:Holliday junction resolvase RusA-like endonuclease